MFFKKYQLQKSPFAGESQNLITDTIRRTVIILTPIFFSKSNAHIDTQWFTTMIDDETMIVNIWISFSPVFNDFISRNFFCFFCIIKFIHFMKL